MREKIEDLIRCEVCKKLYEDKNYYNPVMDEDGCRLRMDLCSYCKNKLPEELPF